MCVRPHSQVADTNHSTSPEQQQQQQQLDDQQTLQDLDPEHASEDTQPIASESSLMSRAGSGLLIDPPGGRPDVNLHSAHVTAICKLCKLHVEIDRNEAAREEVCVPPIHDKQDAPAKSLVPDTCSQKRGGLSIGHTVSVDGDSLVCVGGDLFSSTTTQPALLCRSAPIRL